MSVELLFALAVFVASLVALYGWYRSLKRYRTITDTPTHFVRSAPQGYVELVGSAAPIPGVEIKSVLSGTPCVWYRYKVEYKDSSQKRSWKEESSGDSDQNFALDDGTGICIIDPDDALFESVTKEVWRSTSGGEQVRYTEQRIHTGDPLYALGFFQTFHAPSFDSELNDLTGEILREWKRDHEWLLTQFDSNRDGNIDLVEWEVVRQKAAETARYDLNENYDSSPYNMLTKSPNRGQELIVSTADPDKLAKRFLWYSVASLAGAAGLFGYLVLKLIPELV